MKRTAIARAVGALVLLAVVALGTIALWPASEEEVQIDALASTDLEEVRRAADLLAASGATGALEPLRGARERLIDLMVNSADQDLRLFAHDFDYRRVSDRRQSSGARHLWRALGAVTRAIATLDPRAAEAPRRPREEWEGEWEAPTQEEWDQATLELPTEDESRQAAEEERTSPPDATPVEDGASERPRLEEAPTEDVPAAEDLPAEDLPMDAEPRTEATPDGGASRSP